MMLNSTLMPTNKVIMFEKPCFEKTELADFINNTNLTNSSICKEENISYNVSVINIYRYYLILAIAGIGMFGNGSAIATLATMKPIMSSSILMIAFAVADSLVLIVDVVSITIIKMEIWLGNAGCKIMLYLVPSVTRLSNWILVAMTIERCFVIVSPIQAYTGNLKRKAYAYIAIIGVFVIAVSMSLIYPFIYEEGSSGFGFKCSLKSQYAGFFKVWSLVEGALQSLLPWTLISVLNMAIICRLRVSSKIKGRELHKGGCQRQITVMLITASLTFCVLTMPYEVFHIYELFWTDEDNAIETNTFYIVHSVSFVMVDINHGINFYLYILSGKKFRDHFIKITCGK